MYSMAKAETMALYEGYIQVISYSGGNFKDFLYLSSPHNLHLSIGKYGTIKHVLMT